MQQQLQLITWSRVMIAESSLKGVKPIIQLLHPQD